MIINYSLLTIHLSSDPSIEALLVQRSFSVVEAQMEALAQEDNSPLTTFTP